MSNFVDLQFNENILKGGTTSFARTAVQSTPVGISMINPLTAPAGQEWNTVASTGEEDGLKVVLNSSEGETKKGDLQEDFQAKNIYAYPKIFPLPNTYIGDHEREEFEVYKMESKLRFIETFIEDPTFNILNFKNYASKYILSKEIINISIQEDIINLKLIECNISELKNTINNKLAINKKREENKKMQKEKHTPEITQSIEKILNRHGLNDDTYYKENVDKFKSFLIEVLLPFHEKKRLVSYVNLSKLLKEQKKNYVGNQEDQENIFTILRLKDDIQIENNKIMNNWKNKQIELNNKRSNKQEKKNIFDECGGCKHCSSWKCRCGHGYDWQSLGVSK